MACKPCEENKKKNKVQRVVEGYKNVCKVIVGISDKQVEQIFNNRMKICDTCEFKKLILKVNDIEVFKCTECGCPLDAKLRSEQEVCPIGKW